MKISITNADGVVTYQESLTSKFTTTKTDTSTSTDSTSSTGSTSKTSSDPAELAQKASFKTTLDKATLAEQLDTVKSYEEIFREASDYYTIDYNLLTAMAQKESNFDTNATSSGGAMGLMQLMPSTAQYLGVTDAYDPYENVMGAAKYMCELIAQYDGDVDLALAAYNVGSGTVAAYGGIPPQAQSYVDKIHSIMSAGADVPDTTYIDKNATKEEKEADLMTLIADLPDTEEFADIRKRLAEMNYI